MRDLAPVRHTTKKGLPTVAFKKTFAERNKRIMNIEGRNRSRNLVDICVCQRTCLEMKRSPDKTINIGMAGLKDFFVAKAQRTSVGCT